MRRRCRSPTGWDDIDWQQGYGFQLWMSQHGYRGDGAFGQYMVVLPEYDAVVAMFSCIERMQIILDAMWEHLLPAMKADALPPGLTRRRRAGPTNGTPGAPDRRGQRASVVRTWRM